MPSTLIRRSRRLVDELNESELMFIKYLISDELWRPIIAAEKAGYKHPAIAASKLMSKPIICEALGREQRRRLERLQLKADEVLHVLATGLFFNPLSLFRPGRSGEWVVEDLDKIPEDIGRLIESIKTKTVEESNSDGVSVTTYFEIKMISKTKLLEMAMKHCGIDGTTKIEHSGNVGVSVGLEGGLNSLLEAVEAARKNQIVDGAVVESFVESSPLNIESRGVSL